MGQEDVPGRFIHYMSWQFTTPMPGARLFDIAGTTISIAARPRKVWESFDEHNACMTLPGISEKTMRRKLEKASS